MMTKIERYNYQLPEKLIANHPVEPRDASRLLFFDTKNQKIADKYFSDLIGILKKGDLIVTNNSKVFPARLLGHKNTGGKIEVLAIEKKDEEWKVLIGGKTNIGERIDFDSNFYCTVIEKNGKEAKVKFNLAGDSFWQAIVKNGHMPIPPYIKDSKLSEKDLRVEYQTVYAQNYGSAAAPTAGLHFTKNMIGDLEDIGIKFASIDLHVGLGTFAPLDEENIKTKKLHKENFSIPHSTVLEINKTKKTGGRIIAVGTTTVRALESATPEISSGGNYSGSTDIFIQPGDKFQMVDGLITNFHLPKSSLMMLVAAFIQNKGIEDGREKLLELYNHAIAKNYRFYSFGDAMLIM
jgi:S-adenosylmethionine:tRNA ribosyltransferase-isomerase